MSSYCFLPLSPRRNQRRWKRQFLCLHGTAGLPCVLFARPCHSTHECSAPGSNNNATSPPRACLVCPLPPPPPLSTSSPLQLYVGIVLVVVVFITATFTYLQEARSEHIMEGFRKLVPTKCHVIREGASLVIDASDLVPGDLVEVVEGDKVPADVRLTSANDLMVRDEHGRRQRVVSGQHCLQCTSSDADVVVPWPYLQSQQSTEVLFTLPMSTSSSPPTPSSLPPPLSIPPAASWTTLP